MQKTRNHIKLHPDKNIFVRIGTRKMKNKNKNCWIIKMCDKKTQENENTLKNCWKLIIYDKKIGK